jgi:hypothetical protein
MLRVDLDVHQHRPRVDEVERPGRERVRADVAAQHRDVRSADLREDAELEVRRGDMTLGADRLGELARHGAAAAADLEAARAAPDAEPLQPPHRQRVEPLLEQLEPARLRGGRMRERVVGSLVHASDLLLAPLRCPGPRRRR